MTDHCDATVEDDQSIQSAVDAASTGDTICVEDGTYEEEVTIDVEGLTLTAVDGHEPTLDGDQSLENAITVTADDVTIEGLEIFEYSDGSSIVVEDASDVTIKDTDVLHPHFGNSGAGVRITDSPDTTVENCLIEEHPDGILIQNADGVTIVDSTIDDASGGTNAAVKIENGSEDVVIENNDVSNSGNGIRLLSGSHRARIEDNDVFDGGDGIRLSGSDDVDVLENSVTDSNDRALRLFESQGVTVDDNSFDNTSREPAVEVIEYSHECSITNNQVSNADHEGVRVVDSDNLTIEGNTIEENDVWSPDLSGLRLENSSGTSVIDNTITDNEIRGIFVLPGDGSTTNVTLENNTVSGHDVDVHIEHVENATVEDNDLETGIVLSGTTLGHFDHSFSDNTSGGDPVFYASGEDDPSVPANAGQVIVVDCTNVTVSGGAFDGVATGIQVAYCDDATVSDNTLTDMAGSDEVSLEPDSTAPWGSVLTVWSSDDATVSSNTITETDWNGLNVFDSDSVDLTDNDISDTDRYVVTLENCPNATVHDNEISDSAERSGLYLREGNHGSDVTENDISGNNNEGLEIEDSDDLLVEDNDVWDNRSGITFDTVEDVTVRNNTVTDQEATGIVSSVAFSGDNENVTIEDNTVNGNNVGISLDDASEDVTVTNNDISNNDEAGIDADTGTITGNTLSDDVVGIYTSEDITIEDNTITDASKYGIYFEGTDGGTAENNTLEDNELAGIFVEESENVEVVNNTADNVADLYLYESENITVTDNDFQSGLKIDVDIMDLGQFDHTFSDNEVQGGPLYYAVDEAEPDPPDDAGQIVIADSGDVDISEQSCDGSCAPMQVLHSGDVTVSGVTITDSPGTAIRIVSCPSASVDDCSITGSRGDGIAVEDVAPVHVTDTEVTESGATGVALEVPDPAGGSTVVGNTITDNDTGIELGVAGWGDLRDLEIEENVIHDNDTGIEIPGEDAGGVTFTDNSIQGNDFGLYYDASWNDNVDVTETWWGDESGPSGGIDDGCANAVADGDGDEIHEDGDDGVCFDPWLDEDPLTEPELELSVSIDGDTISVGGEATISVSATEVEAVQIRQLWGGWLVVDEDLDGGSGTDAIDDEGTFDIEWTGLQADVSPSITVELPGETYVGGTFGIEVSATDGEDTETDSTTIEIDTN